MKILISQQKYKQQTFCARKKEIKEAGELVRKARKSFPMYSPTYAEEFHLNIPRNINPEKEIRKIKLANKIIHQLKKAREDEKVAIFQRRRFFSGNETPFIRQLSRIQRDKLGNCEEASIITMALLATNGYKNAKRMDLEVVGQLVDKETKRVVLTSQSQSLDHAFVICPMDNRNETPKENDYIVLDAWMDFADSMSGAKARYKRLFSQDDRVVINKIKDDFSLQRIDLFERTGKILNWADHEIRYKLVFKDADNYTEDDIKALGSYTRMMYPHLCL